MKLSKAGKLQELAQFVYVGMIIGGGLALQVLLLGQLCRQLIYLVGR
jgi:UPF0716 family protein affecting phage T7 exclusion